MQVIASQRQLEAKYSQAKDTSDQWYRRAQLALEKGDEGLAREALSRRKGYDVRAPDFFCNMVVQARASFALVSCSQTEFDHPQKCLQLAAAVLMVLCIGKYRQVGLFT